VSQNRQWCSSYPPGVGHEAPPLPYRNLGHLVHEIARTFATRRAVTLVLPNGMEASLSFRDVDRLAEAFASYLREGLGLKPGTRVAILLPNCLAYPICAFGVLKAGCVVVNTNPLYTPRELEHQLLDCGAEVLVVLDHFGDKVTEVIPKTKVREVILTGIGDFFPWIHGLLIKTKLTLSRQVPRIEVPHIRLKTALRQGALYHTKERLLHREHPVPEPGIDDLALLQYTGGTTGTSKGAMLTHGNLMANLSQIHEITRGYIRPGEETSMSVLPMYHVFAFTINMLFGFFSGSHNILIPNPRPLKNLRAAFRNHDITWMSAVNTLLKALPDEKWFAEAPPRHLHSVYAGGMQTHPQALERWESLTGSTVIEGYGLTEASPLVTFNPPIRENGRVRRYLSQVGGAGLPLPGTDVRIVDESDQPVAPGEHGELVVRGPQVMQGYWNQPEENARTLRGGWLHTGDIATLDPSGYVTITDRKKDMIIVSGFNVFPNEVEACIALHPDVADVAVIGIPHEATGEAVHAYVVAKCHGLTHEEIRAHCKKLLANYKIPTHVNFIGELPKNAVGKALRRLLRQTIHRA